jgi:Cu/Ag efflux pump CusA
MRVRRALVHAAGAFTPAIQTSLLIAALSFLPVLAFPGETGRLLRPLALGKTLVILAAALVTFTLAPALRDRLLRGGVRRELDNRVVRELVRAYRPVVHFALSRPLLTLATATLAVISCLRCLVGIGGRFRGSGNQSTGSVETMAFANVGRSMQAEVADLDEALGRRCCRNRPMKSAEGTDAVSEPRVRKTIWSPSSLTRRALLMATRCV